MKPSVLASIIIFIISAIRFGISGKLNVNIYLQGTIILTIFFTACYFYYLTIAVDGNYKDLKTPKEKCRKVWWIQSLQFVLFYSLWFLLELKFGIIYYAFALFTIYGTYLKWNNIHSDFLKNDDIGKLVKKFDVFGFVCAVIFLISMWFVPEKDVPFSDAPIPFICGIGSSVLLATASIVGLIALSTKLKYNILSYLDPDGEEI